MMRLRVLLILLLLAAQARAGGPLLVGGPSHAPGVPFRWDPAQPVRYWTDRGGLGTLDKAGADALTSQAFGVWQAVSTSTVTFSKSGDLAVDVNAANILALANDPSSELNTKTAIVYDADGSATDMLLGGGASNFVLGFSLILAISTDGVNNRITLGGALLNGKFIDGQPNPEVSVEIFKETFIHEFGHLIGLDHSQINVAVLEGAPQRTADNLAGLPIMFPFALPDVPARPSLAPDDVAAVSALYPEPGFAGATARIRGAIRFSDGTTPVMGVNVIARQVDEPATPEDESRRNAVSTVAGYLFTESAGNPLIAGSSSPWGSRDQTLIGAYDLPGLAAGEYTVEVEAINPEFLGGSSVGPIGNIGFQFPIPGSCAREFLNAGESDVDDCGDWTPVTLAPGETRSVDTDIILNGTPPGSDAWEGARLWRPVSLPARTGAGVSA